MPQSADGGKAEQARIYLRWSLSAWGAIAGPGKRLLEVMLTGRPRPLRMNFHIAHSERKSSGSGGDE